MQTVYLNMIPGSVMPVINLTQFDEGREFALVVNNGSQAADLTNATILISGRKGDDTAFSYGQSDTVKGNYVISVSGNTVTIRNTLQMAAAFGEVTATLTIKKSAADISTLNFKIMVQEHPLDGVDISETEIPGIITLAQEQADEAEAWATGEIDGTPVPSTAPQYNNSAEFWAGQAQIAVQGALHFSGSCTFASIPSSGMEVGDMWNITDAFTTDSRFREGTGVQCKAGTNIAWDGTYWDVLATGSPIALPTGGIKGQVVVKNSSSNQDAVWGAGTYFFETLAEAQAAVTGGTVPNGAIVMVDEIGGGVMVTPGMCDLKDVQITSIANGNVLIYNSSTQKWENKPIDSAISTTSSNPVKNSVIAAALANGRISFGVNGDGDFGYKKDGADTIYPFAGMTPTISPTPAPSPTPPGAIIYAYQTDKSCAYGDLNFKQYTATVDAATTEAKVCVVKAPNNKVWFGVGVAISYNAYASGCPARVYIGAISGIYGTDGTSYNGYGIWMISDKIGGSSDMFDAGASYLLQVAYLEADAPVNP